MAESMTGYGKGEISCGDCRFLIEIKSVNNRYCDVQIRSPRILMFMENRVREKILQRLVRGKIDVFITVEDRRSDGAEATVNRGLALAYSKALTEISAITGREDTAGADVISRFADVITPSFVDWPEEVLERNVFSVLESALSGVSEMRKVEGRRLTADLKKKTDGLFLLLEQIKERAPSVPEEYRKRLSGRLRDLVLPFDGVEFDEARKEIELAIFADKCSIDEELVRLDSHLRQLDSTLRTDGAIGKKTDFLLQEINREVNTIGSKGNDLTISELVVEAKAELEKIREQIQNLV